MEMKLKVQRLLAIATLCLHRIHGEDTLVSKLLDRSLDESDPDSLSLFRGALQNVGKLDDLLGNPAKNVTVFAPTNKAIRASVQFQRYTLGVNETALPWHHHLVETIKQHVVEGSTLLSSQIFDPQVTELQSLRDPIEVAQFEQTVQGASILEKDILASNGVLHVVDKVLHPNFFDETFAQLELQSEFGPDSLDRVALTDVMDFVGGRNVLNEIRDEGTTFLGCRIRAFNRLEEYLPQTVNGAATVKYGEFLNETYKEETIHIFLQYSLIPKNYYNQDLSASMTELTVPVPQCGHMWVTKRNGQLCFNNGCVVATPDPRNFLASNGVGYVLDKCQVCPGIAMLVTTASEYTEYNQKSTAEFFDASGWNLRDLRLSVGDGSAVTLFASINTGWGFFNLEDKTRLVVGDKWEMHRLDLLRHMIVQGRYMLDDLQTKYNQEGVYNLTTLANQTITVDFDQTKNKLTVEGGDLFLPNIEGVDGLVHFTNELPLPLSVTHTVYDIGKEHPNFSTQIDYIDTVLLQSDLKRLLPLTVMYAPNVAYEGKVVAWESIVNNLLENMMFEDLVWCDTLRDLANTGTSIESLNTRTWNITINAEGFPCFNAVVDTNVVGDAPRPQPRACITKCDTLARNGLVHELDTVLFFGNVEETSAPAFTPTVSNGSAPSQPTVFSRPTTTNEPTAARPSFAPTSPQPSVSPSEAPSFSPSENPTTIPSGSPSQMPSFNPSDVPSRVPSFAPSAAPSLGPSTLPSSSPTKSAARASRQNHTRTKIPQLLFLVMANVLVASLLMLFF